MAPQSDPRAGLSSRTARALGASVEGTESSLALFCANLSMFCDALPQSLSSVVIALFGFV